MFCVLQLSDPHLLATGFFRELPAGDGRSAMRLAGNGIRIDGRTAAMRPPPRLGEHTRALLRETGMTDDAIDALMAAGAAAEAPPLAVPTGEDR